MQFKTCKLYLCTISYLTTDKCNIRNSRCRLLSIASFCSCLSSSNQPTYLGSTPRCIFSHSRYILMEPLTVIVTDALPCLSGKNPSGIAGNGVSTTWCTPRHGVMTAAPTWILRIFLIFMTPRVAACVSKRVPGCSLGSIRFIFEVGDLKTVLLDDRWKCLLLS